jgi:hypothetical protein
MECHWFYQYDINDFKMVYIIDQLSAGLRSMRKCCLELLFTHDVVLFDLNRRLQASGSTKHKIKHEYVPVSFFTMHCISMKFDCCCEAENLWTARLVVAYNRQVPCSANVNMLQLRHRSPWPTAFALSNQMVIDSIRA